MDGITIDGTTFHVHVVPDTVRRVAELIEGPNAGDMLNNRHERDLIGTEFSYELQIEPDWMDFRDYDELFALLATPQPTHSVVLPFGQEVLSFEAMVKTVSDGLIGEANGINRWHGMTVTFNPVQPQWEATE